METGSSGLPARTRVAAWSARYCAEFDRAELFAADLHRFSAEFHAGELGRLRFARLSCSGSAIDRGPSPEAQPAAPASTGNAHSYTLVVQLKGSGRLSQYGHIAQLEAGDMVLCDSAAPHAHHMSEHSELILLRIPAPDLREQLPAPEQFCGHRLAGDAGMTPMAAALIENLCRRFGGLPASVQDCLSRQAMEMIGLAFTLTFGNLISPSSAVGSRHARARLYIEQNLRDPDLGPSSIARSLKVSSRYLRMIFASANESVSSYILRRRLEETARQLTDPRWRGRSICEIAFGWGFNSAPHFSRSFRGRYGMSPRQYRTRQAGPHGYVQPDTLAAAS